MDREISELDYVSPNWNNAEWWNNYYKKELESGSADRLMERNPWHLIRVIRNLRYEPPLRILDAGTGISFLSEFVVYIGHKVMGIDISSIAIETCRNRTIPPEKLAECLQHNYNRRYTKEGRQCLDRKTGEAVDLVKKLISLYREGGEILAYEVMDWNDPKILERFGPFDLIINENGFRNGSNEFIRESLNSFYRLLKPGGIFIESNFNLIDRLKTIESMVTNTGFTKLDEWHFYDDKDIRHGLNINRNEKYAVCFWPTG
jgi:SAM-dependent methyltransferase